MKNKLLAGLLLLISQVQAQKSEGDVLTSDFFKTNRNNFRKELPPRSVAVIFSSTEKVRSNDVIYPFHQDPNFYYLTGLEEANSMLMIFTEVYEIAGDTLKEILFLSGRSIEYERWNGARLGTVGAKEKLGFRAAFQNTDFADFPLKFDQFDHIFVSLPGGELCDDPHDRGDLHSMIKHFRHKTDTLKSRTDYSKAATHLAALREIKNGAEITLMRRAIDITCESQKQLMKAIDTSFTEYEAEALIEYHFRKEGSESPGFPSIVGGGPNSCVLHYTENQSQLTEGDLLVIDVGAEYSNYSADVTRTIPVNGKYSDEQRSIYDLVLKAQKAGIEKCRKGNKFWEPHEAAMEVIQEGLKDLGVIRKIHEAKKYFMHGTSHYLGLDVHDAGTFQSLKVNSVITVEPGIYIPQNSDCDRKWWNIGVRIEDDILITSGDPENLSDCVPREVSEIEALMAE